MIVVQSTLSQVLQQLTAVAPLGATLQLDSRRIATGDIFVALTATDSAHYINDAIARGAAVVLAAGFTAAHQAQLAQTKCTAIQWPLVDQAYSQLIKAFYGAPDHDLAVVAITGTNGKTTCSQWLAQGFAHWQKQALAIGTLGVIKHRHDGSVKTWRQTGYTTPDSAQLFDVLRQAKTAGISNVALEASSIGLAAGRLDQLQIQTAVLTNLTQDHLDYHGSMLTYEAAKAKLFEWQSLQHVVLNLDDPFSWRLLQRIEAQAPGRLQIAGYTRQAVIGRQFLARQPQALLVSLTNSAPQSEVSNDADGAKGLIAQRLQLHYQQQQEVQQAQVAVPFIGDFNVSNALAVMATWLLHGMPWKNALESLRHLNPIRGRMEIVSRSPMVIIDYAHTPDALEKVLHQLRPIANARQGKLWCVCGCGGNRDASKRPLMGRAALLADEPIFTADNPRDESPVAIIEQMQQGLSGARVRAISDRSEAILWAISHAADADVVVIAGKGHESTQEIKGVNYPFEDQTHAQLALRSRALKGGVSSATIDAVALGRRGQA